MAVPRSGSPRGQAPHQVRGRLHGHDDRAGGYCLRIGLGFFAPLRMTLRQAQGKLSPTARLLRYARNDERG